MADPVFFKPSREITIGDVADFTGASLRDPKLAPRSVVRLASSEDAGEDALVFVDGKKNAESLLKIKAAGVLCTPAVADSVPQQNADLVTRSPHRDFAAVGRMLFPSAVKPESLLGETGISPAAFVHPSAHIEEGATVEAGAVVGKNASIGAGTLIAATAVIAKNCQVGR